MMAGKTFNVAIVGYGYSAKTFQLPFLQQIPSFRITSIVQRHPSPSSNAANDFPGAKIWRSTQEMLDNENNNDDPAVSSNKIDLVVITTPVTSHVDLTTVCLRAGKHVVVEKPFVATEAEGRALVALAKQRGVFLSVYQNRRWDADFVTVSDLIASGKLGKVVEFETHFDRWVPERPSAAEDSWQERKAPGVGVLHDFGSHLFDQAVVLFGMPKWVWGRVGWQREGAGEETANDSFTALLGYADGKLITVKATLMSAEEEQLRFWVRGDKGSYKKYHLDPVEEQMQAGMKVTDEGFSIEPDERAGTLTTTSDGKLVRERYLTHSPPTWVAFYRELERAIKGEDAPLAVTAEQACDVLKIIELVEESSKSGMALAVNDVLGKL